MTRTKQWTKCVLSRARKKMTQVDDFSISISLSFRVFVFVRSPFPRVARTTHAGSITNAPHSPWCMGKVRGDVDHVMYTCKRDAVSRLCLARACRWAEEDASKKPASLIGSG